MRVTLYEFAKDPMKKLVTLWQYHWLILPLLFGGLVTHYTAVCSLLYTPVYLTDCERVFFRGGSCWGHIEYCERTNMKWVWNAHSYLWGDLNISQLAYSLTSLLLPTHVGSPSIELYDFLCVGRFVMLMPMHLTARLLVRECVIFCVGVVLVVGFL